VTPPVTVVVPTRNRRPVLADTLGAVTGQTGVDVCVVVVDEGSSDDTAAFLADLGDDRVQVVRHDQPRGLPAARNVGLKHAATPWVAFCDDDDLWAPDKLASQLAALAARPDCRWSCTGTVSVDHDLRLLGYQRPYDGDDLARAVRVRNVVPAGGSSVVVDRELALELGGFDEVLGACEDWDMWVRLAQRSPVAVVDRPLVAYRVWPGSMSSDPDHMRHWHELVVDRYGGGVAPDVARAALVDKEQYLGRFYLRRRRRLAGAAHFFRMAVRLRLPTHFVHAAVALLAPGLGDRRADRREVSAVPPAWAAEAESWLGARR
jgi:glycosyltransferase involved in cell wall biosynthesis